MKSATVISSSIWAAAVLAWFIEFGAKIAPFCKVNSESVFCSAQDHPILLWGAIGMLMILPPLLINIHFKKKLQSQRG